MKLLKKSLLFIVLFLAYSVSAQERLNLTLETIFRDRLLYPERFSDVVHLNDGEYYCILDDDGITQYAYKSGKAIKTLLSYDALKSKSKEKIEIESFQVSDDMSKILFSANEEAIFRHSTKADYYVWDLKKQSLLKISKNGKLRLAELSPDGTKVGYIRDNNLYVKDLISEEEIAITQDGKKDSIINGTTDWVYEEEFSFTKAWFWSPDGKRIAFLKFDESLVKQYVLTYYGDIYPEQFTYKYPKAGEDNSIVTVNVFNLETRKIDVLNTGENKDIYLPRIQWAPNSSTLAVQRLNRLQNHLEILLFDMNSQNSKVIYNEEHAKYIDITDDFRFLSDGKRFIITSTKSGFNHIYLGNVENCNLVPITKGNFDVIAVKGIDEKKQMVFYTAAAVNAHDKEVYSVNFDGSKTLRLTPKNGTNSPDFSIGCRYFINNWSDINTPFVSTIYKSDGSQLVELINNVKTKEQIAKYNLSPIEFFSFNTSDNITLNGWMLKPPSFNPKAKYPVLLYVYGGPGSNTVENEWMWTNYFWFQFLAKNGYIIVSVDNRGTNFRGDEFKKCTYLQLGKLETIDQIETAKYLSSLEYVDSKRIGIWGWSYGGFLTSLCMTKGANFFKTGIAVAPVTNWRYYDNIYTERYMRKPQDNSSGYDENSPITHAKNLKGNFLIVHGTADDNVHVQNSMDFITALVNANRPFEMQFYPNKNHGISGGYTRFHLYSRMTEFLLKNL